MAASTAHYSGDPADSQLDEVRFLVGDTDCVNAQLSDEEILFLIAQHGDLASAGAAEALSAKFASAVIVQIGQTRRESNRVSGEYRRLAQRLKISGGRLVGGVAPYAGGISHDEKATDAANTDLVQPSTWKGQFDSPRVVEEPTG